MAPSSEIRFCVAGLEVTLVAARPGSLDALAGFYREYPSAGGRPGLVIEVERVPGLGRDRARSQAYPAFDSAWEPPDSVVLSRIDAEGRVVVPPADAGDPAESADSGASGTPGGEQPVRARFRVGDSPNSLEAAIRIGMSIALPRRGALILHASAIAAGGQALVFAGKSGAGKSTIAAMLAAAGHAMLSDELLVIAPGPAGEWAVHVAPFLGAPDLVQRAHRARVPAGGIHFLVQARHHLRMGLAPGEALRELLRHVLVYVAEPGTASLVLAAAARLVGAVPCHRLEFALDPRVGGVLGIT